MPPSMAEGSSPQAIGQLAIERPGRGAPRPAHRRRGEPCRAGPTGEAPGRGQPGGQGRGHEHPHGAGPADYRPGLATDRWTPLGGFSSPRSSGPFSGLRHPLRQRVGSTSGGHPVSSHKNVYELLPTLRSAVGGQCIEGVLLVTTTEPRKWGSGLVPSSLGRSERQLVADLQQRIEPPHATSHRGGGARADRRRHRRRAT